MALIKTEHLVQYANSAYAPFKLGEILRKLVYNWIPPERLRGMSFHSGTANNLPGWDGWVSLSADKAGVAHASLWELSTQAADAGKIRADFKKRLREKLPDGWVHQTTTFVMVTLRKLKNRAGLESELRSLAGNDWFDVQIIDAPAISQWIEKCPAVETWCAEVLNLGNGRFGKSLDGFWQEWSKGTTPQISPSLLLAGRADSAVIKSFAPVPGKQLAIQADSPHEAAAYLHAMLSVTISNDEQERVWDTALVIDNEEDAKRYAREQVPPGVLPITILLPPATGASGLLLNAEHRHYVISAIGKAETAFSYIRLKRALHKDFADVLRDSMGLSAEEAAKQARACGSSVTVWSLWNRMHNGVPGAAHTPSWSRAEHGPSTLGAIFAGGWDEDLKKDTDVVSALSAKAYSDYLEGLQQYMHCDNPLLERAQGIISVVAPTVAFALNFRYLSKGHLEVLKTAIEAVWGEVDSEQRAAFDSDKMLHPLMASKSGYSEWLRKGLAESLLRLSVFSERLDATGVARQYGGVQQYVNQVVSAIGELAKDPVFLYSLENELSTLAEAAPVPFVDALEVALQGNPEQLRRLFIDRGIFAPMMHVGLLSALECIAWDTQHLARSANVLMRLAQIDPGGNASNRPLTSLRTIFLAWAPRTSAPLETRMEILNELANTHPETTWKLALQLLPKWSDISVSTAEPQWKDFGRSSRSADSELTRAAAFGAYVDFAIGLSEKNLTKQVALLDCFSQFPPSQKERLLRSLLEASQSPSKSEAVREPAWAIVRALIGKHRKYKEAFWAMREDVLKRLDVIEASLRPRSPLDRHLWLFDSVYPDAATAAQDLTMGDEILAIWRKNALREIFEDGGLRAVVRLIRASQLPFLVCQSVSENMFSMNQILDLMELCVAGWSSSERLSLQVLSSIQYSRHGILWTDCLIEHATMANWRPELIGECFVKYPDTLVTYRLVESCGEGASTTYWRERSPYFPKEPPKARTYVVRRLLAHKRGLELVDQSLQRLPTRLIREIVSEVINELAEVKVPLRNMNTLQYWLSDAVTILTARKSISKDKVASFEYELFPLIFDQDKGTPRALHLKLAESPDFFVQLVSDLYRPEDCQAPPNVADSETRSKAHIAYQVLHTWKFPPGLAKHGTIDEAQLIEWVRTARGKAANVGRGAVADNTIGSVMFHTPPQEGTRRWPSDEVANMLEKTASLDLEHGIEMEVVNSRGVTMRGVFDGGEQERDLAMTWKARANELPIKFGRARRMCERIAASFEVDAMNGDNQAEQLRMKWSR